MLRILLERIRQGHRTAGYPAQEPSLPDRYRGRPEIKPEACPESCRVCLDACPTEALAREGTGMRLDLARCLFCAACETACPHGAIRMSREYRMSARSRAGLVVGGVETQRMALAVHEQACRLFGRSLKLREVSAGGCNACEADVNVLNTLAFDLGRFGVQFVASPRHADGLLITGPVSANMELALKKTYEAVPCPKIVIAVGACALSGGPFAGHSEVRGGAESVVPVDLYIPGCPPHPYTILDGILRFLGRLPS
jgi:Ni,Fe-hydrogenase III small subunit/Pyruvate/2-oxoacid:ferredoxin oxidoreductase delta subunit